ncbi:cell surface protein [Haloferax sp. Atlit-10N]|uniref:alkaline phosphatase PhoX n=1 Tax=unclassified Haloferax TaxID=2625095 RepID=UPI000E25B8A5|nr:MULTISPECIES: alkaline phosphatase PhoX [unclassified Haloferax]RDZ45122.1 cell surface protein [Haloferax sp. Atlit-16N]RDZ59101.1 cell surface protein [Haloferax sp. Atlit-10N]
MVDFTRRTLMASSVAAALGASVAGVGQAAEPDDPNTPRAPLVRGELKRFSTTAFGAEVTGPFVFDDGSLLYSLQHPDRENPAPYDKAAIGYFSGFQFSFDGESDFDELSTPETNEERRAVRSAAGDYEMLAREGDAINGGSELLGVPQTPDGTNITSGQFSGSKYADAGYTPDCNQFVATNDEGTEGYLFTNWEASPGNVSRIPLSQDDDGSWEADLKNALNLANTEALRELGGTRINCYGDLSPWNTMLSAEENYAHPRVSLTATVSDIVEKGTGEGLRGAHEFWNRPNPTEIQSAVDDYYDDDSWFVQSYWAVAGVELLAYYLGAEPVNQSADGNDLTPIGDVYPNPYRYGYIVDFREPAAETPEPVKYYVMGRAAWECPDVQSDERTVYLASDGDSKGVYKFVADEPIPSYDDPMGLAGTLYAPLVTNDDEAEAAPPADVDLEFEWLKLGHATNDEVAAWIAEYDDVTQADYLGTHTDWSEGDEVTADLLEAADREVVENGNRDYVTDEEIVEWGKQYEWYGPDGVDDDLRHVPFLETRAAAKEIGATIEFNKAEGIDSVDGAEPGNDVYFGISELNDDMSNATGELQLQRVDGGVVYRAELESDYNVSTLEPVIVGPDASDPAAVADDALINVDNLAVMDDGRVLCCEDADQFGRSYKNDCLYVYTPEDDDRGHGNDPDGDDADNPGNGTGGPSRGSGGNDNDDNPGRSDGNGNGN